MWRQGPINTVHCGHNRPKVAVAIKIALPARRWLSVRSAETAEQRNSADSQ